jgi:hypothetical protein
VTNFFKFSGTGILPVTLKAQAGSLCHKFVLLEALSTRFHKYGDVSQRIVPTFHPYYSPTPASRGKTRKKQIVMGYRVAQRTKTTVIRSQRGADRAMDELVFVGEPSWEHSETEVASR